ncbi:MAG TPA: hypothetical protein VNA14_00090 [Mycobacteriales bacterium]|nr:hypothetical protein [Mycobacteriales bacterium]
MTEHERLHRALSDLAGSPPPAPQRAADAVRRAGVRRRRQVGGGSALLAVALVAGALAGGAVEPPRAVSFLEIAGDDDRSGADDEPSRSPSARPSRSPSPGPRSASAQASPRPSSRPTRSPSPTASGQPPAPTQVRVGVRPAEPTAGQRAVLVIGVRDGDGVLLDVRVTFGDGQQASRSFEPACRSERPHPSARTIEMPHVYDRAGTYAVTVNVRTGGCGAAPERREVSRRVQVLPRDGARPGNGGALPVARAQQVRPREETAGPTDYVAVQVGGADSDGYVTRMVLDWGDGTDPSVLTFPLSECRPTESGYPSSRRAAVLRHVYANEGTYGATLVVVSTACDGSAEQTGRTSIRVMDPMPSPSPRPSPSSSPSARRSPPASPAPSPSPTVTRLA